MKNIYSRLFDLKQLIGKVVKDANNPFFKTKYADLNSIIDATDPALAEAGLLYVDRIEGNTLVSELIDAETGEKITSTTPLILPKQDMQAFGGAVTYARRYARVTLLGLQAVDDDGAVASGQSFAKPAQIKKINALLIETETDGQKFLSHYKVNAVKDLYELTADDAIHTLELKKSKMNRKD